jgi:type IV pilus assembly protein PilA
MEQDGIMAAARTGFSLIEMMIVVAIIAILALIAIPSFQDQICRDQINQALPLADIVKKPIAVSWSLIQAFPPDNAGAGLPPPEKIVNNYINSILVQNGAIHFTFGNRANAALTGKMLTLRPAVVTDAPIVPVTWVCGTAEAPTNMTAFGENHTNIPNNFLPFICRPRAQK